MFIIFICSQAEESQQQQQWQADAAVRTSARQLLQTDPVRTRQVRSVSEDRSGNITNCVWLFILKT